MKIHESNSPNTLRTQRAFFGVSQGYVPRADTVKTAQMFAHDPKQSCLIVFELSAQCATTTIYRRVPQAELSTS